MDASYKIQRGIHVHLIQFFMCPEFWVHISFASSAFLFPYKIRQRFSGFLPEFCRKVRADIVEQGNGTLVSCCCGSFCL